MCGELLKEQEKIHTELFYLSVHNGAQDSILVILLAQHDMFFLDFS